MSIFNANSSRKDIMKLIKTLILLAGLIFCSPSSFGALVVNFNVTPSTISMTDNTGGSLTTGAGSVSLTYSEPQFDGANMYNEESAVIFPYEPATSSYWIAIVNGSSQDGGYASVTLEQMYLSPGQLANELGGFAGGFSVGFWATWSDFFVSLGVGSYLPGWQSFGPFWITGDVPTFQNGMEVADQPFQFAVDLNFNFAAVPEPSTFFAGALPVIVLGLQGIRFVRNRMKSA
jgi:hypothetical protein